MLHWPVQQFGYRYRPSYILLCKKCHAEWTKMTCILKYGNRLHTAVLQVVLFEYCWWAFIRDDKFQIFTLTSGFKRQIPCFSKFKYGT